MAIFQVVDKGGEIQFFASSFLTFCESADKCVKLSQSLAN